MLTKQKIDHKLEAIMGSGLSPMGKAKALLGLRRNVLKTASALADLGFRFHSQNEVIRRRHCFKSAATTIEVAEHLRWLARQCLTEPTHRITFGYAPRGNAVPRWSLDIGSRPWRPGEVNA